MMKKILFSFLLCCIAALCAAQNVGIGTATPNASAMLDVSSSSKGLLMPRMTSAQRNAIASPAKGLIVFDTNSNSYWYYNGTSWKEIAGNNYNSDSALVLGQQVGTVISHNMTVYSSSSDSSGYLYDSGGPLGNYGNNENFVYTIYPFTYPMATDIIVLSNNLESPYDSLIITDGFGHRYVLLGTTTGTYRVFGTVSIQFKSNFANTLSGFAIRWNGVYPGTKNNYDTSQTTGWYYNPAKNYMRGGVNANNNWSPDSSGMYSFAFGNNNKAMGYSSLAIGYITTASGSSSIAMGANTTASSNFSIAMGASTTASGSNSTALGFGTIASGSNSTAIGNYTIASVSNSTAMGYGTIASGASSTAMGTYTSAGGTHSTAMGYYTKSKSYGGLSIGLYNDSSNAANATGFNPLNRIFQIGNGTADNARSNAVTVLQNGNVGIRTTTPQSTLQVSNGAVLFDGPTGATPVSGAGTRMMWIPEKGAFRAGLVQGTQWDDANIGLNSFASGASAIASANYSIAMGIFTTASGNTSLAMGSSTTASGVNSTAMGYGSIASGRASTAMGLFTISKSNGGVVVGGYNDSTNAADPNAINSLNRVFQIGNGYSNARSNAMTVLYNGNVGIGLTSPVALLDVNGNASFNDKTILLRNGADLNHGLKYDAGVNGPYLFGFDGGALGAAGFQHALTWDWRGNVKISNSLTVQNGKGIIRSTDGTQKKELSTNVVVNASLGGGGTTSIDFTFPESFGGSPDVYVGNIVSGAGGWAEVIMTIANVSTTGGTLYVHNSTGGTWTPNFTVKVIAIGPQ